MKPSEYFEQMARKCREEAKAAPAFLAATLLTFANMADSNARRAKIWLDDEWIADEEEKQP